MGLVYRARDVTLRREVALKLLPPELVDDEKRRKRFLREARLAAAMVHPNIATLFDVGEEGASVFLAMELVRGKTLREKMRSRGPLDRDEIVRLGVGIGSGLAEAHAAGIVHRDLKPDNVMTSPPDFVKILDFGLAKLDRREGGATSLGTEPGRVLGTPGYMSPEQARGNDVDARSDVFSFGVLLFELATGKRPFRGDTLTDILVAHREDAPETIAGHRRDLPRALSDLVAQCLAADPKDRPAMKDVVERLRALPRGRRPAALVVSVVVLIAAIAAAAAAASR
jgi:serine/threonine-protein kinase